MELKWMTARELMEMPEDSGWEPSWKIIENCRYCGYYEVRNTQGRWGVACSGCKGTLTKRLRSGKYGPRNAKATKERLMATRYEYTTRKWIEGLNRHWYEYDWNTRIGMSGKPRLDYQYVDLRIPITKEELLRE